MASSEFSIQHSSFSIPRVPLPKLDLTFRVATLADLTFLDALQKRHGKALGYFPTKQFEGYIEVGAVLVAQSGASPVGYCISRDRYLKRDELGVVYQLCVAPGRERGYVGAALVQEVFRRSAYGCRLYCCWCAQDLPANDFWESMGFVPVAFRTGGGTAKKRRVHIFWQARICEGDTETKWWYPAKTEGGAMRADRIVFPIPPGTHWKDVQPIDIEGAEPEPAKLEGPRPRKAKTPQPVALARINRSRIGAGALRFGSLPTASAPAPVAPTAIIKPAAEPKPKARKIDPKLVAAARELRDRWLEQVNAGAYVLEDAGKYDVSKTLSAVEASRMLPQLGAVDGREGWPVAGLLPAA